MKSKVYFSIITGLFFFLAVCTRETYAQGQSLSIYPPVIEIQTEAPSSPSVPLTIQNNDTEDITLKIELIPIKQQGENGDVTIVPELGNTGFYKYYKDRIQLLVEGKKASTLELEALESKDIELNVNLLKGDPPGDFYYAVTFISEASGPSETSISRIPNGIGTNLLLSIGPKEKSTGGVSRFKAPSFLSKGPVNFELMVHNASKHLIQPSGSIEITNIFGGKEGKVEILPQYILAGGDRFLKDTTQSTNEFKNDTPNIETPIVVWPEKFLFGLYKAKALVKLEDNGPSIEAMTYFIAFPLYFFIPIALTIFIGLGIYLRLRRKL